MAMDEEGEEWVVPFLKKHPMEYQVALGSPDRDQQFKLEPLPVGFGRDGKNQAFRRLDQRSRADGGGASRAITGMVAFCKDRSRDTAHLKYSCRIYTLRCGICTPNRIATSPSKSSAPAFAEDPRAGRVKRGGPGAGLCSGKPEAKSRTPSQAALQA